MMIIDQPGHVTGRIIQLESKESCIYLVDGGDEYVIGRDNCDRSYKIIFSIKSVINSVGTIENEQFLHENSWELAYA